jgi:hypothetical protein
VSEDVGCRTAIVTTASSRPVLHLAVVSGVDLAAAIDAYLSQPDLAATTRAKYCHPRDVVIRRVYFADLKAWYAWYTQRELDPLQARRHDVALWARRRAERPQASTGKVQAPASIARRRRSQAAKT